MYVSPWKTHSVVVVSCGDVHTESHSAGVETVQAHRWSVVEREQAFAELYRSGEMFAENVQPLNLQWAALRLPVAPMRNVDDALAKIDYELGDFLQHALYTKTLYCLINIRTYNYSRCIYTCMWNVLSSIHTHTDRIAAISLYRF